MFDIIKKIAKKPSMFFLYCRLFFVYKKARFQGGHFRLLGNDIIFVDPASFVAMYVDIFINEAYRFKAETARPLIVDCGANIGLSVLYFKTLYPDAIIEAFEPDKTVFGVLESNCGTFGLREVTLINKGVWTDNNGVMFSPDGADGGRITPTLLNENSCEIKTIRLKEFLDKKGKIDLLKIDIEGAEVDVLHDCRESLSRVKLLFVEYHSSVKGGQSLDKLLADLTHAGFRYYINSIGGSSKNYFLYRGEDNGFDLQLNIYARRA